jgi:hypothetical protein
MVCNHKGSSFTWHYVDDFATVGPPQSLHCSFNLHTIRSTIEEAGFEIAEEKVDGPGTRIKLLGWIMDTVELTVTVPQDKRDKILAQVELFNGKQKRTKRELLSLIGSLNFVCRFVAAGRPYLARLIKSANKVRCLEHHPTLNSKARADLAWWREFLVSFNGSAAMVDLSCISRDCKVIYTDASDSGFGALCGRAWIAETFSPDRAEGSINRRELFAVLAAVHTWRHDLLGHRVQVFTDNQAAAYIANTRWSPVPELTALVRRIDQIAASHGFVLSSSHIPGHLNSGADLLSRNRLSEFCGRFHSDFSQRNVACSSLNDMF